MPIVGGLDIHRKQLTLPDLRHRDREVDRRRSPRRARSACAAWLARHRRPSAASRSRWRFTGRRWPELAAAGIAAHMGQPADTAAARGRKRHAKTDKTDSRHLRALLAKGRLPECWVPPAQILEYRALLETYHDLRREHTAWVQRIHAVFFRGRPALGEGALRAEQDLAALRAAARARGSCGPGGELQVATALDMLAAVEARLGPLRHQLRDAARHLTGAKVLVARLYGVGPITALALTCWLAGEGRFSSSARRSGSPGWTSPCGLRTAKARPGACPGKDRPCCAGRVYLAGKTHARAAAPDHAYYATVKDRKNSKRAALSEARKIVRQASATS